jgi:nitrite reductase/ring-hydroxylating ferredoxin subunit
MAEWRSVGRDDLLADGAMQPVNVGEHVLLLARVGGVYYATQGRCPHLRGNLSRGKLEDKIVTCPLHGSRFNVTTGECIAWVEGLPGLIRGAATALAGPKNLDTYSTKVQDGQVWVLI